MVEVAQQVGVPHQHLVVGVLPLRLPIPVEGVLCNDFVLPLLCEVQGELVVGIPSESATLGFLFVPSGDEPLVVAQGLEIVSKPCNGIVPDQVIFDLLLEEGDCG